MVMLAPGTWLRSPLPEPDLRQILHVEAIPAKKDGFASACAPVVLRKAWHLTSPNDLFGGFSALVTLDDGRFLAGSDRGAMMIFDSPEAPASQNALPPKLWQPAATGAIKRNADLEALTRDPKTGQVWGGFEYTNSITRYDAELTPEKNFAPPAMRDWWPNSGPEAVVRLNDGHFIVVAERANSGEDHYSPALLFPDDPVEEAEPIAFRFPTPDGMAPVDATLLPDGRVAILLRDVSFALPPRFHTRIVVGDPATIRPGKTWQISDLATLTDSALFENYEGLAAEPAGDGTVFLWMIADDNLAMFQRTLMLKLQWDPAAACAKP